MAASSEDVAEWWIVGHPSHPKVAVRGPAGDELVPDRAGKPIAVLKAGAVVRASHIEEHGGAQWLRLAQAELPLFVGKKCPQRPAGAWMIIDWQGERLLAEAPGDLDFRAVANLAPADRHEEARKRAEAAEDELLEGECPLSEFTDLPTFVRDEAFWGKPEPPPADERPGFGSRTADPLNPRTNWDDCMDNDFMRA